MDSILDSIKKLLGIDHDYDAFDADIIVSINTAIATLEQIGVETEGHFMISGNEETWSDYLGDQNEILSFIKSYLFIKTKMQFDPPQSSILNDVYNKQLSELEFRIKLIADEGR